MKVVIYFKSGSNIAFDDVSAESISEIDSCFASKYASVWMGKYLLDFSCVEFIELRE